MLVQPFERVEELTSSRMGEAKKELRGGGEGESCEGVSERLGWSRTSLQVGNRATCCFLRGVGVLINGEAGGGQEPNPQTRPNKSNLSIIF